METKKWGAVVDIRGLEGPLSLPCWGKTGLCDKDTHTKVYKWNISRITADQGDSTDWFLCFGRSNLACRYVCLLLWGGENSTPFCRKHTWFARCDLLNHLNYSNFSLGSNLLWPWGYQQSVIKCYATWWPVRLIFNANFSLKKDRKNETPSVSHFTLKPYYSDMPGVKVSGANSPNMPRCKAYFKANLNSPNVSVASLGDTTSSN